MNTTQNQGTTGRMSIAVQRHYSEAELKRSSVVYMNDDGTSI